MLSRTLRSLLWFPALVVLREPVLAQQMSPVDRQLVAAAVWSEPRYIFAYWVAVRGDWVVARTVCPGDAVVAVMRVNRMTSVPPAARRAGRNSLSLAQFR